MGLKLGAKERLTRRNVRTSAFGTSGLRATDESDEVDDGHSCASDAIGYHAYLNRSTEKKKLGQLSRLDFWRGKMRSQRLG
jgi:hypothetical protein